MVTTLVAEVEYRGRCCWNLVLDYTEVQAVWLCNVYALFLSLALNLECCRRYRAGVFKHLKLGVYSQTTEVSDKTMYYHVQY